LFQFFLLNYRCCRHYCMHYINWYWHRYNIPL